MEDNFLVTYENFIIFKTINDPEHKFIDVRMTKGQFKDKYATKYYEGYKYGMAIAHQNHNIPLEKKFISVVQGSDSSGISYIIFVDYEDYQEFMQTAYHNGIIDGISGLYFNDDVKK